MSEKTLLEIIEKVLIKRIVNPKQIAKEIEKEVIDYFETVEEEV